MRGYLNSNGMNLLPEDLRSVIVPVDKLTNNMGEAQDVSAVTTTSDSLWLFSLAELAGPIPADVWEGDYEYISAIFNAESSRYKLFSDMSVNWNDANPIIAKNYQNSSIAWWERSTSSTRVDDFLCVTSEGKPFYSVNADDSGGVVPGFCI